MKSWSLGLAVVLVLHGWVSPSCSWGEETAGTEEQEIRQLITRIAELSLKRRPFLPDSESARISREFRGAWETVDSKLRGLGCESRPLLQKIFGEDKGPGRLGLAYMRRSTILSLIRNLRYDLRPGIPPELSYYFRDCPNEPEVVEWLIGVARHSDNAYVRCEAADIASWEVRERDLYEKIIPVYIEHISDTEICRYRPPTRDVGGDIEAAETTICESSNARLETFFLKHLWGVDCRNPRDRKKMQEVWQKYWEKNRGKLVWCRGEGRFVKKRKWNVDKCGDPV